MNSEGVRDVYLPTGEWVDFWTGERLEGSRWLKQAKMPLERMPIYVKSGAQIPIYPHPVQCTDEMDLAQIATLTFDDSYQGILNSVLGDLVGL
jgi:alpha-D-xyloside xylohydrolase